MLDCALDLTTALNFLPLPIVQSQKLSQLNNYNVKDDQDSAIEGVSHY